MRRDRAVVDDAAAHRLLVLHDAGGPVGAQAGAVADRANDAAPLGPFEVLDLGGGAKTGVVEQNVEPPEGRLGLGTPRLDRAGIADIGRHTERLDLQRLDLADAGLQWLRSTSGNDDRKAFARQ